MSSRAGTIDGPDVHQIHVHGFTAPSRDVRIEVLRLMAMIGISVFHVFQPWFDQASRAMGSVVMDPGIARLSSLWGVLWVMGLISLLGAWGNHVFFMISGLFLVPSMAAKSHAVGYWRAQATSTLRRVKVILASVALYAVIAFVIDSCGVRMDNLRRLSWWATGLEFVWLYLIFVVLAPAIAWCVARVPMRPLLTGLVAVVMMIFLINGYIALDSNGDAARGLFEWRKQMSAVTYLVAFVAAGVLGTALKRLDGRRASSWSRMWTATAWATMLLSCVAVAVSLHFSVVSMVSYKSTSVLSFMMALSMVMARASRSAFCRGPRAMPPSAASTELPGSSCESRMRVVPRMASGILGFYIMQSMMHALWFEPVETMMSEVLRRFTVAPDVAGVMWAVLFLVAGVVLGVAFAVVLTVVDGVLRRPMFRALGWLR